MNFLSPLGLIALTLAAFVAGEWLYERSGRLLILQPVLIAILALVAIVKATGLSYDRYFQGTTALHFLLGPAIVALAVPLYENLKAARGVIVPVFCTLFVAGLWVTGSALLLGALFRLDRLMELSLTTKSVTVPIGLVVAEKIGGTASLTVVSVFTTGLTGIVITPLLMRWMRISDPKIAGFTLGLTSHALGVVRAMELGDEAVAFATLGMTLMGCASAIIVPLMFRWIGSL